MNKLVYLLFGVVVFSGYLSENVSKYLGLIPELISGILLIIVVLKVGMDRSVSLRPAYLILAGLGALHITAGLIINTVAPSVIINGLRPHIKWLPVFLLPVVYRFSDEKIERQLKFLLFLALFQMPLALYQRLIEFAGKPTGDYVTGTMGYGGSGVLSVFLVSAIAVVTTFYAAGRMRLMTFVILIIILFLPTTINETKATIFLLPIAIIIPFVFGSQRKLNVLHIGGLSVLIAALLGGYAYIYDKYETLDPYGMPIGKFVANDKSATEYLFSGADLSKGTLKSGQIGAVTYPKQMLIVGKGGRRLDNILLPLRSLSTDPVRLWVGLGIGSVSTGFRQDFSGEFSRPLSQVANEDLLAFQLWETGIGGAVLFLCLLYFLFRDASNLARSTTETSTWANGWAAVIIIVVATLPYVHLILNNALIYPFAFFSGHLAAEYYRMVGSKSLRAS
jgi:hypothetical protein